MCILPAQGSRKEIGLKTNEEKTQKKELNYSPRLVTSSNILFTVVQPQMGSELCHSKFTLIWTGFSSNQKYEPLSTANKSYTSSYLCSSS